MTNDTIDLLVEPGLGRLAQILGMSLPLIQACEPGAWQNGADGEPAVKSIVYSEVAKVAKALRALGNTHELAPKGTVELLGHIRANLEAGDSDDVTLDSIRDNLNAPSGKPDVRLDPPCVYCTLPIEAPSQAKTVVGLGYAHRGCTQ